MNTNSIEHLVIKDPDRPGRFRFTATAIDRYGQMFAEAGFDMRKIKDKKTAEETFNIVMNHRFKRFAADPDFAVVDDVMSGIESWEAGVKERPAAPKKSFLKLVE